MNIKDYICEKEDGGKCVYIKISDANALNNMRNGCFWFRHCDYFRYEDIVNHNKERGDAKDNSIEEIYNISAFAGNECVGKAKVEFDRLITDIDSERILCLYQLDIDKRGFFKPIDKRLLSFDDYYVFVKLNDIIESISRLYPDFQIKHEEAFYYSQDEHNGKVGNFGKPNSHSHQCEYRIVLKSDNFLNEVLKEKNILSLSEKIKHLYNITRNNKLEDEIRYAADDDKVETEIELCKCKSKFVEKLTLDKELVSDKFCLDKLLGNGELNIFEIFK